MTRLLLGFATICINVINIYIISVNHAVDIDLQPHARLCSEHFVWMILSLFVLIAILKWVQL